MKRQEELPLYLHGLCVCLIILVFFFLSVLLSLWACCSLQEGPAGLHVMLHNPLMCPVKKKKRAELRMFIYLIE